MPVADKNLLIFDCDGVLVDSEPISIQILVEAVRQAGVDLDEAGAYRRFLGRSLSTVTDALKDEYGLTVGTDFLEGMRHALYERFRRELKPIEGIAEALDRIDMRRCVASSSQLERIRLSLSVTGLLERLEPNIFSASMVKRGKPAPDLFLHAARAMHAQPDQCIVIEDSPAGIEAAKAAGMTVFAFTGGSHAAGPSHVERIEALAPDRVFDAMADLIQLVQNKE
ncbi:HAD family hydrolase [Rhizobiaceae bacterium n13]|uniref:HAD family hydrolase n=1 Tax=Ferirhizobium litorale TaxID=2927786 RepID=A0AAE3QBF2_9HYPH|nr:HAD family hydrolase [Fererhizobium litorale]MDI7860390.1 HAD family hydrolase [Fererhizobium litorale]MDI7920525.1 HAD family hydrolase [Fererhizobium litorale]